LGSSSNKHLEAGVDEKIDVDWIPLKRYLELYDETPDAVKARVKKKLWARGVHYNVPEGAGTWISIKAVNAWAAGQMAALAANLGSAPEPGAV
jgi:hypothetical protein